jgi:hypothetical protein
MRNALRTSVRRGGAYPNVYFADLAPPSSDPKSCTAPTSSSHNTLIPTGNVFEAAMQRCVPALRGANHHSTQCEPHF